VSVLVARINDAWNPSQRPEDNEQEDDANPAFQTQNSSVVVMTLLNDNYWLNSGLLVDDLRWGLLVDYLWWWRVISLLVVSLFSHSN